MLLRLATLGAIGYVAYSYYQKNRELFAATPGRSSRADDGRLDLAGGPISARAKVVHAGEAPMD
jgi:hypothetical protein